MRIFRGAVVSLLVALSGASAVFAQTSAAVRVVSAQRVLDYESTTLRVTPGNDDLVVLVVTLSGVADASKRRSDAPVAEIDTTTTTGASHVMHPFAQLSPTGNLVLVAIVPADQREFTLRLPREPVTLTVDGGATVSQILKVAPYRVGIRR